MELTDAQARAIDAIVSWYKQPNGREFYLAGYAGSGKTTLVDHVINKLRSRGAQRIVTGAYTGKAAAVMRAKGAINPMTIHSMIYSPVENEITGEVTFVLDPEGAAALADLIILDECSMIDTDMADDLRSFGRPILVIGDPGQLPPVRGHGAFTGREPDVFLSEIHRQAADSPIIQLATMARRGVPIRCGEYGPGVRVVPYDAAAGEYVYDDASQVICGMNRVRWTLTQKMRARRGIGGRHPWVGEPVMCCRNSRKLGICNGQQGTLSWFDFDEDDPTMGIISARMDDGTKIIEQRSHHYLFDQHFYGPIKRPKISKNVQEFDWGYVLTCHKAQGSQWPRVTIIDDSAAFRDDRHKWLYTAITRAEAELTIISRNPA